jgi:hypothetical protein
MITVTKVVKCDGCGYSENTEFTNQLSGSQFQVTLPPTWLAPPGWYEQYCPDCTAKIMKSASLTRVKAS